MNYRRSLRSLVRAMSVWSLLSGVAFPVPPASGAPRLAAADEFARGTSQPPLVATKGKANGAVLSPGKAVKLKVKVTDRTGRPVAGVRVRFIAPETGAGGTFQGGEPPLSTVVSVATNASGVATARLVANDVSGPYLVSAVVDQAPDQAATASLTFALTNGTSGAPPLAAARARAAVHEQLLSSAPLDETLQLHGPVLLATGTLVEAGGPSTDLYPTEPFTTTRPSWLFWIDENPGAAYLHPTRFVVVDASDTTPMPATEARVTREGWWPRITPPGATTSVNLLPASYRATDVPEETPARSRGDVPPSPRMPAMDACAVVACGPPERQLQNDAAYAVEFFEETLGVPHVFTTGNTGNISNRPVTIASLNNLLAMASEQMPPCRKLYLYITSHANGGGFQVLKPPNGVEDYKYPALARELQRLFAAKGTEICIILTGCSTGGAIGDLQNYGLHGTVVAGSQLGNFSYMENESDTNPHPGHAFGTKLRAAWRDWNNDGHATLEEAFTHLPDDPLVTPGHPIMFPIYPTTPSLPVPPVVIPDKTRTVKVVFSRPPLAPTNTSDVLRLDIPNPNVAVFANGNSARNVTFMPGVVSVEVEFRGLQDGVTNYTASFSIDAITFTGTSTIRVGSGYGVIPNPIRVKVGETKTATLARGGVFEQVPHPTPILLLSSNPAVAGPASGTLTMAPYQKEIAFQVQGVSAGTAIVTLVDPVHGVSTTVNVEVVAEKCAFFSGAIPCETGDRDDVCMHHEFILLNQFDLNVVMESGGENDPVMVTLSGTNPQTCQASGTVDPATCSITTGECQATVAGLSNVRNQWRNVVFSESTNRITGERTVTVTGQYALGIGGELPGGCPIIYTFTGSVTVAGAMEP